MGPKGRSTTRFGILVAFVISLLSPHFTGFSHAQAPSIQQTSVQTLLSLEPKLDGSQASARIQEARLLYRAGNKELDVRAYDNAIAHYTRALQLEPSFPPLHYNLGMLYLAIGEKKEAARHLRSFLELKPNAVNATEVTQLIRQLDR